MKSKDQEEIRSILHKILKNSVTVGGGSPDGKSSGSPDEKRIERRQMRDPSLIWDLGLRLQLALNNSQVPEEKRKEEIRRISREMDSKILGRGNEWCISAYEWVVHFKDKDFYIFVAKLAGYRENRDKNRFTKRRVRYLRPIYTRFDEPTLSKSKREKLTEILQDDKTLSLTDPQYYDIIKKVRGSDAINWPELMSLIGDLSYLVEDAMDDPNDENKRRKLREELGDLLITQIRYALQLCVIDNKNDYDYAYDIAKKVFQKPSKKKNYTFQQLFENLKVLVKNFEEKNKHIKKTEYYELEQLNSKLDAISNEEIYHEFTNRKKAIGEIFG